MDIRTTLLAVALMATILLFGLAFLGMGYGEELLNPTIDMQEAMRIVLTQFPNARIKDIELETEDGRLVYEVELVTAEGQKQEVHVNARTGRIDTIERD